MAENDVQSNSGTESDIPNPKKGTAAKKGPHEVETQFESLNRVKKLPVVEAAIHLSQDVYGRVKREFFLRLNFCKM